jgi:hypothetical protein
MGLNLGIALGSAAEAGVNSYSTFKKLQREEEAAKRDQERFDRERKAWQEQDDAAKLMRDAYAAPSGQSIGQALQGLRSEDMTPAARAELESSLSALPPEQAQAALQAYGKAYGGNANAGVVQGKGGLTVTDKPYNPEQAYVDAALKAGNATALKEARANQLTGLQIQGAQQGIKKGEYELRGLQKQEDFDAKFQASMSEFSDKFKKRAEDFNTTLEVDGKRGVLEKFGPEAKKMGYDVTLMGNDLIVKGPDNKKIVLSTPDQIKEMYGQLLQADYAKSFEGHLVSSGLFRSPQEVIAYMQKKEELGLKGREVATREALVPSEIRKNDAAAAASSAHAGVYRNMLEVAKTNKEAGAAMQPYLDKIADLASKGASPDSPEIQSLMVQAATAGAQKSRDIAGLLSTLRKKDTSGIDAAWSEIEKDLYKNQSTPEAITAARNQFFASRGYAPQAASAAIASGVLNGKKLTAQDVDNFNAKFPNSAVDKSKLPWLQSSSTAIPEPEKREPPKKSPFGEGLSWR